MIVLGSRASIGGVLAQGRGGAAAQWWLSGGVSAANAIAVYQPKGAASLAASYTNLANPGTYDAAPGVAPTFDTATGWAFNGSNQYLNSGVVPASGWSALVRFANLSAGGDKTPFGAYSSASTRFTLNVDYATYNRIIYQNGGTLVKAPGITSGVVGFAGNVAYRNGSAETGTIGAWSGTATRAIYIGATNNTGIVTEYWPGDILAIAFYNTTLSAAQVAAISAAMAAL